MSKHKNNNDTIGWDNIKTDKFSPTSRSLNNINPEVSKLVLNLFYQIINRNKSKKG